MAGNPPFPATRAAADDDDHIPGPTEHDRFDPNRWSLLLVLFDGSRVRKLTDAATCPHGRATPDGRLHRGPLARDLGRLHGTAAAKREHRPCVPAHPT